MRSLSFIIVGALVLCAACAKEKKADVGLTRTATAPATRTAASGTPARPSPSPTPSTILQACFAAQTPLTPVPSPTVPAGETGLIVTDPRNLVLPADAVIPGSFRVNDGSIATGQWNRAWDRDPADPGSATGATRITIQARIFLSLEDAAGDFAETASGVGGLALLRAGIEQRAFEKQNICVRQISFDSLGTAQQQAWRVEFTRGRPEDTYVQYFIFMRVHNTRALVSTFAQHVNGAEAPRLLEDTKQVAKLQATYLSGLPTQ